MPISKSATKALHNAEAKASRNRYRKSVLKDALRGVAVAEPTAELFNKAVSVVDKAVKWGIIHQNKAARIKSQLSKTVTVTASEPKAKKVSAKTITKPVVKKAVAKKTPTTKK
jgi:small subunit ribosomal protein S20